jgi:predicted nucleotidyltransferase
MHDLTTLRALRDTILQLAQRRKATNVRVFGSVAKRTARGASDIDFLVSMERGATLVDLIGLEQDLEALLGRDVDVLTDDAIHPRLAEEVRSTAVRL